MSALPAIDTAADYVARGWSPIPVPFKKKGPTMPRWQELRVTSETLEAHFGTLASNVGVLLGEPSGGLVDVDLDCAEAVKAAPFILPPTLTFGRAGRRKSHHLYISPDASVMKLSEPTVIANAGKVTLVELRTTRQQTVFPGSVHPSGEHIEWTGSGPNDPSLISGDDLKGLVHKLGSASLLARHWPKGERHDASMALAGALLRDGWTVSEVEAFVQAVAVAADDEEASERPKCVTGTKTKLDAGQPVTGWPAVSARLGDDAVAAVQKWLGVDRQVVAPTSAGAGSPKRKQADELVKLAQAHCKFFKDERGTAYARRDNEVLSVRSSRFRTLLSKLSFDARGSVAGGTATNDAINTLIGLAIHGGPTESVYARVAEHAGNIYLDLANDAHEVVEITKTGWGIITACPVNFYRSGGMLSLPRPVEGPEDVVDLFDFVNLSGADDLALVVSWLLAALRPRGPYPILVLQGRQGSAKSTAARILCALIDPNEGAVRTPSRNIHELMITAQHSQVLAYDNLSGLTHAQSDAFCRLSTGTAFSTRELYTDSEEKLFKASRPLILNGIDDLLSRPDLADRALMITLPEISREKRRSEKQLWDEFGVRAPGLLAVLLDGVSRALRDEPRVVLSSTPRMADFVRWAAAGLPGVGMSPGQLQCAMTKSKLEAITVALESDPLGEAVQGFLDDVGGHWSGTASQLLKGVRDGKASDEQRELPHAANTLTNRLRRLAPNLQEVGVHLEETRSAGERLLTLTRRNVGPSSPSPAKTAQKSTGVSASTVTSTVIVGAPPVVTVKPTPVTVPPAATVNPEPTETEECLADDGDDGDDDV